MFVPTGTASVTLLAWSGRTGESIGKIGCGEGKEVKKKKGRKRERKGGREREREKDSLKFLYTRDGAKHF